MRILRQLTPAVLLVSSALFLAACKSPEERAEDRYQSALALLSEGDVDRAIVELRNVFELNGKHIEARQTMGKLQLERNNHRAAYRQYLLLAEFDPDDLESRIILTELAFLAGNWEELDRHGARTEELAPDDPRVEAIALVRTYRSAIEQEDEAERRSLGQRADVMLADQPENFLLRNILMDNAIREQTFTRALEEIDWLIAYQPTSSKYYKERLRILATLGDMSAIEDQLRNMMEIFPDDPTHKATLIRFYVGRGNLDAAESVLRDLSKASEPDDPSPTIDLIRFLAEFRDTEAVQIEIEKAISERPDPVPFLVIQATLDFSLGKREKAITTLEDVLATSESSDQTNRIKVALAQMLLATGNEVGARTHVEEVLSEKATEPEALKMQAAWQIEADETDLAIGRLRMVLDQQPEDAEAMTLMANAYARAGQPGLAKDLLAQAVEASGNAPAETLRYAQLLVGEKRYLPAEDILLAALRLDPSNSEILIALGKLYLLMEDFGRVRSVVDTLNRMGGENEKLAANQIEAERLNRQSGVSDALSFLEDLANESEATLGTKIALVRAKLGTGDEVGALTLAQELKQENPDNIAIDSILAVVNIANNDLDTAETLYRDILASNPNQSGIWLSLSRLKMRQGDKDEAVAVIDAGIGQNPDKTDLLWAKASFEELEGDVDEAIKIYEKLYELNSSSIIIANNLASLLSTHRNDEESLEQAWRIARRLQDANSPALMDTYGWILHRRGKSDEALTYLEKAAQGLPGDAIVQYHLGQVYVALERTDEALAQFRMAVEIAGPTDTRPLIENARALLQSLPNAGAQEN